MKNPLNQKTPFGRKKIVMFRMVGSLLIAWSVVTGIALLSDIFSSD